MALFTKQEEEEIRKAVEAAEAKTSGEIRICAEKKCPEDPLDRAVAYFTQLEMDKTALRNGVLIYIATEDHKFAIIGDSGINKVVPPNFWNTTKEAMLAHFRKGELAEGIITGIHMAGEKLQAFFPLQDGDVNELSDDISYM
ncbi:TPM domain-containing protein [Pedobacter sp. SYSU D00535]|uniref:TPM domain-containing protein n=1 Tax=Pedobacter sp. SYSU D00535 TaxID=2810308 RepID=UPI001A96039F